MMEKFIRKDVTRLSLEQTMEQINTLRIKPKRKIKPKHFKINADSLITTSVQTQSDFNTPQNKNDQ